MSFIFPTEVDSIPCQCRVDFYAPYVPMHTTGSGFGDADPPEEETFEFMLLDEFGNESPMLMELLTDEGEQRLKEEYLTQISSS